MVPWNDLVLLTRQTETMFSTIFFFKVCVCVRVFGEILIKALVFRIQDLYRFRGIYISISCRVIDSILIGRPRDQSARRLQCCFRHSPGTNYHVIHLPMLWKSLKIKSFWESILLNFCKRMLKTLVWNYGRHEKQRIGQEERWRF